MKTAVHLLLGQYLVERCGTPHLRCHRRAFLLGCVEPDYNVFSYLRGCDIMRNSVDTTRKIPLRSFRTASRTSKDIHSTLRGTTSALER